MVSWICNYEFWILKVRTFWETHKIWKNLPHGFDKSADLLSKRQNHEEDFFQIMCASQKVRTLKYPCLPYKVASKPQNSLMVHFYWICTRPRHQFDLDLSCSKKVNISHGRLLRIFEQKSKFWVIIWKIHWTFNLYCGLYSKTYNAPTP